MVADFPKEFLNIFTTIYGQFVVFFIFNTIVEYGSNDFDIVNVIIEAFFAVILFQCLKLIIMKIYS
jgi:hypothetical protein